mmetsp:Transcript_99421/g.176341  ORF Transcript_99421/g.176341 Transcript_99421/m.176341 type:complete len:547 (+) Transcript_99421:48-1688(+)
MSFHSAGLCGFDECIDGHDYRSNDHVAWGEANPGHDIYGPTQDHRYAWHTAQSGQFNRRTPVSTGSWLRSHSTGYGHPRSLVPPPPQTSFASNWQPGFAFAPMPSRAAHTSAQAPPMATVGLDTSLDGRPNIYLTGLDCNRDGIPDVLQQESPSFYSLTPPFLAVTTAAPRGGAASPTRTPRSSGSPGGSPASAEQVAGLVKEEVSPVLAQFAAQMERQKLSYWDGLNSQLQLECRAVTEQFWARKEVLLREAEERKNYIDNQLQARMSSLDRERNEQVIGLHTTAYERKSKLEQTATGMAVEYHKQFAAAPPPQIKRESSVPQMPRMEEYTFQHRLPPTVAPGSERFAGGSPLQPTASRMESIASESIVPPVGNQLLPASNCESSGAWAAGLASGAAPQQQLFSLDPAVAPAPIFLPSVSAVHQSHCVLPPPPPELPVSRQPGAIATHFSPAAMHPPAHVPYTGDAKTDAAITQALTASTFAEQASYSPSAFETPRTGSDALTPGSKTSVQVVEVDGEEYGELSSRVFEIAALDGKPLAIVQMLK